jgi:hypothetical protein
MMGIELHQLPEAIDIYIKDKSIKVRRESSAPGKFTGKVTAGRDGDSCGDRRASSHIGDEP